jgi:hypothetical protein
MSKSDEQEGLNKYSDTRNAKSCMIGHITCWHFSKACLDSSINILALEGLKQLLLSVHMS